MASNMMMAWHYTRGHGYREIIDSGFLKCTDAGISDGEKPVLWFSINQLWEPTVNGAMLLDDRRTVKYFNMQETREREGCYRFGVSSNLLIPWIDLIKVASIPSKVRKALESTARNKGSNPYQWYGYMEALDIRETVIEVMDENYKWQGV